MVDKTKIAVIDDRATLTMTFRELRTLRKILGCQSTYQLSHSYGLSESEIETFSAMYRALGDFFSETA